MLQRIQAEVARYERVITYWPSFGPSLEAAVCAALRTTTAAVSRQCGLIPMIGVSTFPCHTVLLTQMRFASCCLPYAAAGKIPYSLPGKAHTLCAIDVSCFILTALHPHNTFLL